MIGKFSFLSRFLLIIALLATPLGNLRADTCESLVCGDADGNGVYDINDIAFITDFLYAGGPAPALCGDIDGYDLITVRDIVAAAALQPPICVSQPKIVAQPTSLMKLYYQRVFSQNQSSSTFSLKFINFSIDKIRAFDLPLAITVDSQIPLALSVDLSSSTWPGEDITFSIDTGAGTILLSDLDGSVPPGDYTLCNITIHTPFSADTRFTRLDYAELAPYMTGVIEPPNSACHYPMFLDLNLNAWKPLLRTEECLCGDANDDGQFTVSDPVRIIVFIFGTPYPGEPCLMDANGSGTLSISDAVYLISYIFLGGPEPHCP